MPFLPAEFYTTVEIIRPEVSSDPYANAQAIMDKDMLTIEDLSTDVRVGDIIRRQHRNGVVDHFSVVGMQSTEHPELHHIELTLARCPAPQPPVARASTTAPQDAPPSTWISRDQPVLQAAHRILEEMAEHPQVRPEEIAAAVSFDVDDVYLAIRALRSDNLIDPVQVGADQKIWLVQGLTGRGRRAAGVWPSSHDATQELIAALVAITEDENQPEDERAGARKLLSTVSTIGTNVTGAILTAVAMRASGLA